MLRRFKNKRVDPLAILGIAILLVGIGLVAYGFIPFQQANYKFVASGQVPLDDPSGKYIQSPENYFQKNYTGAGSIDKVTCSPDQTGYYCYGFQLVGTRTFFSAVSRYYGLGLIVLGFGSYYASSRLEPFGPKQSLSRPIKIRVDEDICVANEVCVKLVPSVFQLKKQEAPTIIAPVAYVVDPSAASNDAILEAAQMCPTGAIIIEDAETGERIHPPPPKS